MNKCAHCGELTDEWSSYSSEPQDGIPEFSLCRPCGRLLCDKLTKNVVPYLSTVGYGAVAHTKRVTIIKNFIHLT